MGVSFFDGHTPRKHTDAEGDAYLLIAATIFIIVFSFDSSESGSLFTSFFLVMLYYVFYFAAVYVKLVRAMDSKDDDRKQCSPIKAFLYTHVQFVTMLFVWAWFLTSISDVVNHYSESCTAGARTDSFYDGCWRVWGISSDYTTESNLQQLTTIAPVYKHGFRGGYGALPLGDTTEDNDAVGFTVSQLQYAMSLEMNVFDTLFNLFAVSNAFGNEAVRHSNVHNDDDKAQGKQTHVFAKEGVLGMFNLYTAYGNTHSIERAPVTMLTRGKHARSVYAVNNCPQ